MIRIRVARDDQGKWSRIVIRGHASGVMGKRVCTGVSVLSRALLYSLGRDTSRRSKELSWGRFDCSIGPSAPEQRAARYTINGYKMLATMAPSHVTIIGVKVGNGSAAGTTTSMRPFKR